MEFACLSRNSWTTPWLLKSLICGPFQAYSYSDRLQYTTYATCLTNPRFISAGICSCRPGQRDRVSSRRSPYLSTNTLSKSTRPVRVTKPPSAPPFFSRNPLTSVGAMRTLSRHPQAGNPQDRFCTTRPDHSRQYLTIPAKHTASSLSSVRCTYTDTLSNQSARSEIQPRNLPPPPFHPIPSTYPPFVGHNSLVSVGPLPYPI